MTMELSLLSPSNPVFISYAYYCTLTLAKMGAMSVYTMYHQLRRTLASQGARPGLRVSSSGWQSDQIHLML